MQKWIWVVFVILAFFLVAAVVERRRLAALEAWRRERGFTALDPFVPEDHRPISLLAAQVTGRDLISLRWASAFAAVSGDNTKVTLAEFLYTPSGRQTSTWFTLAVWPSPRVPGPLVLTPGGRSAFGEAIRKVTWRPKMAIAERQGPVEGSLAVVSEPAVWQAWLTEGRRRALEAWPHGGQFVLMEGYTGWTTEGLLTASRADQLLAQIEEARRALR